MNFEYTLKRCRELLQTFWKWLLGFRRNKRRLEPQASNLGLLSVEQLLGVYETFRSYARHEDNLINNRVTWMLTIHGFLYATYGLSVQAKIAALDKPYDPAKESLLGDPISQLEGLLVLVPLVGFCISLLAWNSIRAAKNAVTAIEEIFQKQTAAPKDWTLNVALLKGTDGGSVIVPGIGGGGRPYLKTFGHSASLTIPWVLMASWIIALSTSSLPMRLSNLVGDIRHWLGQGPPGFM